MTLAACGGEAREPESVAEAIHPAESAVRAIDPAELAGRLLTPEEEQEFERTERKVLDEVDAAESSSATENHSWWVGHWSGPFGSLRHLAIGSSGEFIARETWCDGEAGACGRVTDLSEEGLTLDYTVRWTGSFRLGSRRLRRIKVDGLDALVIEPLWLQAHEDAELGASLVASNAFVRDVRVTKASASEPAVQLDGPPIELK